MEWIRDLHRPPSPDQTSLTKTTAANRLGRERHFSIQAGVGGGKNDKKNTVRSTIGDVPETHMG